MHWKPAVKVTGGGDKWSTNSLVFATEEEAYASANELAMRWFAVTEWSAQPSDEPVTHVFKDGRNLRIEEAQV